MEEPSRGWRARHLAPGLRQRPAADFPTRQREAAMEPGPGGRHAATYWRSQPAGGRAGGRTGVKATAVRSAELQPETRLAAWKALQEANRSHGGPAANLLSLLPP